MSTTSPHPRQGYVHWPSVFTIPTKVGTTCKWENWGTDRQRQLPQAAIQTEVCVTPEAQLLKRMFICCGELGLGHRRGKDAATRPHPGVWEEKVERIEGEASPHRFGCRSSWPWSWLHVARTESSDSHPSDSLRISCADHSPRPNPSPWVFPQLTFQWFYGEAIRRAPCPEKNKHQAMMWVPETRLSEARRRPR